MGFSGVLLAVVGVAWGKQHKFKEMLWVNKWYLIVPAFLPHVNVLIHIYCMLIGYAIGSTCYKILPDIYASRDT